jgi:hypothetical protein
MYVFLFAPLSSWTSIVWKRLLGLCGCDEETPGTKVMTDRRYTPTYLLVYRRVGQTISRLCLLEVGCSSDGREQRGKKEIEQRVTEREREVGFLFHWGRCHSGANAPTGGTMAGHLTCWTAPTRCVHFLESCARRRISLTKHVDHPGDHKHSKKNLEAPLLANLSFLCGTHTHSRGGFYGISGVEIVPAVRNVLFIQGGR